MYCHFIQVVNLVYKVKSRKLLPGNIHAKFTKYHRRKRPPRYLSKTRSNLMSTRRPMWMAPKKSKSKLKSNLVILRPIWLQSGRISATLSKDYGRKFTRKLLQNCKTKSTISSTVCKKSRMHRSKTKIKVKRTRQLFNNLNNREMKQNLQHQRHLKRNQT